MAKPKLTKQDEDRDITEIRCPNCGQWQPLESYRMYTVNPHYMDELTPVLQCQNPIEEEGRSGHRICMHIFAPTIFAVKVRQDLLANVETK